MKLFLFFILVPYFICAMSLKDACFKDDIAAVSELIEQNAELIHKYDAEGFLPVHHAVYAHTFNVLFLFYQKDPHLINATDKRGNIPFIHLFLAIYDWKENIEKKKILNELMRFAEISGIVRRLGPTIVQEEEADRKQYARYKEIIDFFIKKNANLEIANNYGKKWTDIPGLDAELAAYAQEQLKKIQDEK